MFLVRKCCDFTQQDTLIGSSLVNSIYCSPHAQLRQLTGCGGKTNLFAWVGVDVSIQAWLTLRKVAQTNRQPQVVIMAAPIFIAHHSSPQPSIAFRIFSQTLVACHSPLQPVIADLSSMRPLWIFLMCSVPSSITMVHYGQLPKTQHPSSQTSKLKMYTFSQHEHLEQSHLQSDSTRFMIVDKSFIWSLISLAGPIMNLGFWLTRDYFPTPKFGQSHLTGTLGT